MKRYIKNSTQLSGEQLCTEIEKLLDAEEIPYVYTDCDEWDGELSVFVKTYGDWKNDNDRAHELIVNKFHLDRDEWEETDDESDYGLATGGDSCVVRHEFVWKV